MVARFTFLFGLFLSVIIVLAQEDTVRLDEITIDGVPYQRYSIGGNFKPIELDDHDVELADALSGESSIFFKSTGNQQLTTITFRGSSAQQTQILWHGIQANYPTLGQMDFSQWPVWMMESIDLSAGGDGALYGSGAIGGTVLIDSELKLEQSTYAVATRGLGSFGYHYGGVKANISVGDFKVKIKSFRSDLRNDFYYKSGGQNIKQLNADVHNEGYDALVSYDRGVNKYFFHSQFTKNDRTIQPGIEGARWQGTLVTNNFRTALGVISELDKKSISATAAYLLSDQVFYDTLPTTSHQISLVTSFHHELKNWFSYRMGANTNFFRVTSDNYQQDQDDYQVDLFTSAELKPLKWWTAAINLRQSFYHNNLPFTPSLGNQFTLIENSKTRLKLNAKGAFGFRYPTLNDRYWVPGGNPDLLPERSFTTDFSVDLGQTYSGFIYELCLSTYKTWSEDWIIWLPGVGSIWSPVNYRNVEITGLNLSGSVKTELFGKEVLSFSYDHIESLNQSGQNVNKQMPYTPSQLVTVNYQFQLQKWNLGISENYTGRRFATLDNINDPTLSPYWLLNLTINRSFDTRLAEIHFSGTLKNVLDVSYQVMNNYAMPGRNFELRTSFKIK